MAEAAVSFVVERLGDLLLEKAGSLRSVRDNIQRLQRELLWMQGFLKEVDAWPHRNDRVLQNLVAEIRDLAHEAEDVIESRAFADKKSTLRRLFDSWNVASEIDGLTRRINELGRRLQTYGSIREAGNRGNQQSLQPVQMPRRSYSHLAEQHVIGLEDDAEKIATKLIDGTLRSRSVSICGMGGIGKTTLAKKIYHNTRVRNHFRWFAWECVSQHFNIRDIWEKILFNLASPGGRKRRFFSELKEAEIAEELHQLLMNEKCLVVLDDIWDNKIWDCLRPGFPEGSIQSKILLTTRNEKVALRVDPDCFIHSQRCLNESQSWELFLSVAVRRSDEGFTFDKNLKELGRKIVKRCGGLPLAIKAFGGNLRTKPSLHAWTMVYNNMLSHLSGIDNGMIELGVISLLALSYHDLPYQLKQCFLHLSQFPENFVIPVNTIINIWVAEGIIPKGSMEEEPMVEVEDIAYAYLEDLASRCMIEVGKWSSTRRIKSFRLHDLMRDLCIQEAIKENFFQAKSLEDMNDEAPTQSISTTKFRRLALYMKNSSQHRCLNYDRHAHLRSLLVFSVNTKQAFINESNLVAMTRHFKYLRLLYLYGIKVSPDHEVPTEIGDLVHLRLLDMGSIFVVKFPSSFGKLIRLLTLKLDHVNLMSGGCIVPNIFENMQQLRNLYLPPRILCFELRDIKLSHLRNLQTLVNFPLGYGKVEDIVGLPNLRKLKLISLNSYDFKRLVEMLDISPNTTFNKLRSLSVSFGSWRREAIEITKVAASCPHLHKLKLSGPLVLDLQQGSQIFCQLHKLMFYHSEFAEDPMPHLGKLPNLRVLRLHSALGIDTIMFPKNSFPCLQSLVLSQEGLLEEWIIEEGALSRLSFLKLYFCINLKTLPEGLKFLDSLQELQIDDMPPAFIERIKRGGEDFHKIENVPSILLEINLEVT